MKRGRPNIRRIIQQEIITILAKFNTPIATAVISKEVSEALDRKISWNTTQKYIRELVESGRLQALQLPHSKIENKNGMILYTLKK